MRQPPFRQILPVAQATPSAFGAPAAHFFPPPVTATQVSSPSHGSPSAQLALVTQENVQLVSQPVFGPFCAPRSHSSPVSTVPSPHTPEVHAPLRQVAEPPPVLHGAPSF